MTTFQIACFGLLLLFCCRSIFRFYKEQTSGYAVTLWVLLSATAALAIRNPELTHQAAQILGIGRGADLVFYSAILAALFASYSYYIRLVRLENNLASVVRELAVTTALVEKGLQRSELKE